MIWSTVVLVLASVALVSAEVEVEGEVVLELEHSLDVGKSWSTRGKLTVTSSRSGSGGNDQLSLSGEQKEKLRSLCAEEDGLYLVRAQVWQGGAALGLMRSFTSSCSLVTSGMVDTLTLNTDHKGRVLGFSLAAAAPAQSPGLRDTFKTKIVTNSMEPGPAPDTAAFIQRLEEEKRRQEKGEVPDNRSFLAKYWMYIVPIVIFMAINGAAAPEGS